MKFILLLLISAAVLAGAVLTHRYVYRDRYEADLQGVAETALGGQPEFENVIVTFDGLDGALAGEVPTLEAAAEATRLIAAIDGARLKPENIRLTVPARVEASRDGGNLILSGLLPDEELKSRIFTFIKARAPALEIDATGLAIDSRVTAIAFPEGEDFPGYLSSLWDTLREPAWLAITPTGDALAVEGLLPPGDWTAKIVEALSQVRPDLTVNTDSLRTGDHVRETAFLDGNKLQNFLRGSFVLPATRPIRFEAASLTYGGKATAAQAAAISQFASDLGYAGEQNQGDFEIFPSPYHVPEYRPRSKLAPAALADLRAALREAAVTFELGSAELPASSAEALKATAEAIENAGRSENATLRLVVGGFGEGDAAAGELTRRRAGAVVDALVSHGVAAEMLTVEDFSGTPAAGGDGASREEVVEILVK